MMFSEVLLDVSGELKTAVVLDRETVAEYSLVAHVQDRDTPGWECTSQLIVVVRDVNDNPPVFSSANFTAAVPQDYPPGSFVTILHATDADSGIPTKLTSCSFLPEAKTPPSLSILQGDIGGCDIVRFLGLHFDHALSCRHCNRPHKVTIIEEVNGIKSHISSFKKRRSH